MASPCSSILGHVPSERKQSACPEPLNKLCSRSPCLLYDQVQSTDHCAGFHACCWLSYSRSRVAAVTLTHVSHTPTGCESHNLSCRSENKVQATNISKFQGFFFFSFWKDDIKIVTPTAQPHKLSKGKDSRYVPSGVVPLAPKLPNILFPRQFKSTYCTGDVSEVSRQCKQLVGSDSYGLRCARLYPL